MQSPYLYDVFSKVDLYSQKHEWDIKEEYWLPFGHWGRLVACFTHSRILENCTEIELQTSPSTGKYVVYRKT